MQPNEPLVNVETTRLRELSALFNDKDLQQHRKYADKQKHRAVLNSREHVQLVANHTRIVFVEKLAPDENVKYYSAKRVVVSGALKASMFEIV